MALVGAGVLTKLSRAAVLMEKAPLAASPQLGGPLFGVSDGT